MEPKREKPIAYAFVGPDGLHLVNLKPAAAWLGAGYHNVRATAAALCSGLPVGTPLARRLREEFPELVRPARLEPAAV